MHSSMGSAMEEASSRAGAAGEPMCVVSGMKDGRRIYRVYPMRGFGLPAGGTLEEVVQPAVERVETEPPEKTSANGF